jgi:hypothetical protein
MQMSREFRRKRHSQKSTVTTRPFSLPCYLQSSENSRVVTIEPEMIGDLLICILKMAAQREQNSFKIKDNNVYGSSY